MAKREDPLRGRTLIGVAERIDLPEWGVDQLRVKIDTGARTSALHVDDVELLDEDRVRFSVVLDRKRAHRRVVVEAPIARRATVRSSSGKAQHRIFVATTMRLGPIEKEIEISLASREPMIFRMLLGRTALAHDFVVDPVHRYLHSEAKPKKKKKKQAEPAAAEEVGEVPSEAERAAVAATEPPRKKKKKTTTTPKRSSTKKKKTRSKTKTTVPATRGSVASEPSPQREEGRAPSTPKSEKAQSARRKKRPTKTKASTTKKSTSRRIATASKRGSER